MKQVVRLLCLIEDVNLLLKYSLYFHIHGKVNGKRKEKHILSSFRRIKKIHLYRTTTCKVVNAPVKSLQFMLKRESGNAQVRVEKIGAFETDLQGDVDSGKNMFFGAFALVYVVEGYISVLLDENYAHEQKHVLKAGETLLVERDEDASPTSILMKATTDRGLAPFNGIGIKGGGGNKKINTDYIYIRGYGYCYSNRGRKNIRWHTSKANFRC